MNSYKRSLPSLIGLECETGIIDDCNRSLSNEVLPFSCKGVHMFVSDTTFNECGSECGFRKPNLAIKKGWTKYVRFFLFFTCVILNFNISISYFSFDSPYSGSGDHENYFGMDRVNFTTAYDENGNKYENCIKKAVDIREIEIHRPWFSFGNNSLFFSDLSSQKFVHITADNFEEALIEAKKSIRYTKAVNASYG